MEVKDIYKIWAPEGCKWVEWVRPVPFFFIKKYNHNEFYNILDLKNIFIDKYLEDTAIFVDLIGARSIEFGIALSKIGYRPIPIFNGSDPNIGTIGISDNELLEEALITGSMKLKELKIKKDANPVFLLDSVRTQRYRKSFSVFDNSWDLYGQDIPSYDYFKNNGIKKIIVVSDTIQRDLRKIFFKFKDMDFFITDGFNPVKKVILKKNLKERFEKEEL